MKLREAVHVRSGDSVCCADGTIGVVVRTYSEGFHVQVPGERDVRKIPYRTLEDLGDGVYAEVKDANP